MTPVGERIQLMYPTAVGDLTEIKTMTNIKEIEQAIAQLPRAQLAEFRVWFEKFDAQRFDAAIAQDSEAGNLDRLAEEALAEHRKGQSRQL